MTTIDPTSSSGGVAASPVAQTSLGKDDFLKLLVAQLQHQDPMQPMDDTQFMAQLAQFSTLEQITNVGDELGRLAADSKMGQAVAMIGHRVTYTGSDGSTAQGTVASVEVQDGQVVLTVDGAEVDLSSLLSIA